MSDIKIYQVGGSVRDKIMNIHSKDIDYAVEAPSYSDMKDYILHHGGKIYLEKPEFTTIRARMPYLGDADFVLCRKDGTYSDGRHPDNVTIGTIYDDLARRDFTMNAIAIDTYTGLILDPHHGIDDIGSRVINCVNDPIITFSEDSLRILRAFRFAITLDMYLSQSIVNSLYNLKIINGITNVSNDRIREELTKMFMHDTLSSMTIFEIFYDLRRIVFTYSGIRLKPTQEL